jgi:hypothetical protein
MPEPSLFAKGEMLPCDLEKRFEHTRSSNFRLPDPDFPRVCVVIRIYSCPNPRYHCPFLYDDEDDTIGRQAHSTAIRGLHPNPAQIPNSNIPTIKKSLNPFKTNDKPKS